MYATVTYGELDQIAGEVLPERTVLSTVSDFGGGGGGDTVADFGDDGNDGSTALSACQSTQTPGTPGLLGSLGLGSANPSSTQTCTPAAVANY